MWGPPCLVLSRRPEVAPEDPRAFPERHLVFSVLLPHPSTNHYLPTPHSAQESAPVFPRRVLTSDAWSLIWMSLKIGLHAPNGKFSWEDDQPPDLGTYPIFGLTHLYHDQWPARCNAPRTPEVFFSMAGMPGNMGVSGFAQPFSWTNVKSH